MEKKPTIIFEDDAFLVVNKPAGMVVNRSDTTAAVTTLQDWVEEKLKVKSQKLKVDQSSDFYNRGGIVHRLDKETSGILIIAKTPDAFVELQRQFKERIVKKTYIALAHGKLIGEGEINVPVGRLPWNRKQFGVVAGGRESVTKYKVLSIKYLANKNEPLSLVELYPETGRTHQIRVHLKHIGHPIMSDELYAGRKIARNDRKMLPRVFLHAAKISFMHPTTKEPVEFESPLPEELQNFLRVVESSTSRK